MTYITDINPNDPAFNSPAGQGDDQIRALKADIQQSLPAIAGAVTLTHTEINALPSDIALKAPLASPALTGTATLNGSALTTASDAASLAPLASPAFTGNPTGPTPSTSDNDTSLATTAYVKANMALKADLAGLNTQVFDVASPTADDQAIRRDTYGTQTTGGTVKIWVTGGDTLNIATS